MPDGKCGNGHNLFNQAPGQWVIFSGIKVSIVRASNNHPAQQ
jgi:hypothetical protein